MAGTPGAISVRRNANGTEFYVRQYYDFEGRKRDQYLVQKGVPESLEALSTWKARIDDAKGIQEQVRLLSRAGYSTLDPKHLAALAPLCNHGIFAAGAVLVGTHAFEVIVNRLAIRVPIFATEDVDIARPGKLALAKAPKGDFLHLLRESGIDFIGVPGLKRGSPPTSYKEKGRSRFTFDLLVPTSGDDVETLPVPELNAHATGLPYLRYLLNETQMGAAISTHGIALTRVPAPERFALHKLIVARLRVGRPEKSRKDRRQAAVLIAALGELSPGALEAGYAKTPTSGRRYIRSSLLEIRRDLEGLHPRSWEEISRVAKLD